MQKKIHMKYIIFLQVNVVLLCLNLLLAGITAIKCFAAALAAYFKIKGSFFAFPHDKWSFLKPENLHEDN